MFSPTKLQPGRYGVQHYGLSTCQTGRPGGLRVASAAAVASSLALEPLPSRRPRRVTLLLIGIVLLSIADLMITLAFLRSTGMMEANPLAALVIRWTESSLSLACYKMLTVTVCVGLLFRLRAKVASELAAWCALAVLAFMSVRWHQYATHIDGAQSAMLASSSAAGDEWLVLE